MFTRSQVKTWLLIGVGLACIIVVTAQVGYHMIQGIEDDATLARIIDHMYIVCDTVPVRPLWCPWVLVDPQ